MTTMREILQRFEDAQDSLIFQASDLSLGTIADMVEKGAIDVSPSYQRRERWSPQKQSNLIESFLLNVPVPPIYLAEDSPGRYSVVDGKQRITSIYRFIQDDLTLNGLEEFEEIEDQKFSDLPQDMQNSLEIRPYLRVITLLRQSDPVLKFEVFTRLNRGGEIMAPQELRNVAYRGSLNDLIYELAENEFLRQQLKVRSNKSPAYQLMEDAEFVLRFLTLRESWTKFSGDYRTEMDQFMRERQNATEDKLKEYSRVFNRAIRICEQIWHSEAFKRPTAEGWRDQLLAGMYDAEMIAVDYVSDDVVELAIRNSARIKNETRILFDDPAFDQAVRQGTNTPTRLKYRINKTINLLTGDLY